MSRHRVAQSTREQAEVLAGPCFRNHVVKPEGDGRWLFHEPGTFMHHFRVITGPRMVMIYGDIGEVVFIPSDVNALGWLRCVLRGGPGKISYGYVAEKVPSHIKIAEFSKELLKEYIADLKTEMAEAERDDEADRVRAIDDAIEAVEDAESTESFYGALYASDMEVDDPPTIEALTSQFHHQLVGLHLFCAALDAAEVAHV